MSYYIIFIISLVCIFMLTMFNKPVCKCHDTEKINKLIRQTSRWAVAAEQDTNPYIANLHSTYSLGYLMALREIYNDEYINKLSNVDVRRLETEVTKIMDDAVKKLVTVCPQGQPKNSYLAFLAKEG